MDAPFPVQLDPIWGTRGWGVLLPDSLEISLYPKSSHVPLILGSPVSILFLCTTYISYCRVTMQFISSFNYAVVLICISLVFQNKIIEIKDNYPQNFRASPCLYIVRAGQYIVNLLNQINLDRIPILPVPF